MWISFGIGKHNGNLFVILSNSYLGKITCLTHQATGDAEEIVIRAVKTLDVC